MFPPGVWASGPHPTLIFFFSNWHSTCWMEPCRASAGLGGRSAAKTVSILLELSESRESQAPAVGDQDTGGSLGELSPG